MASGGWIGKVVSGLFNWGSKSYKRYGTDEEYWDENLWIGFHPPCVIYLADITCVSTSSMLLSSKTRVLAFGR